MTEPRTPRTEAGRALLHDSSLLLMMDSQGEIIGLNDGELELHILAIEAEAGAAAPIDVERLADALTAAPSLLLEGDDRDRKEFAEWLLSRLSGPPSGGTDE